MRLIEKCFEDCINEINDYIIKSTDKTLPKEERLTQAQIAKELSDKCNTIISTDAVRKYMRDILNLSTDKSKSTFRDIELQEKKREIEQLKIQLRDERRSWNKQNYNEARFEEVMNLIDERLDNFSNSNFVLKNKINNESNNNSMIVCLSDLHIGQTFKNYFGEYDTDIAKRRMNDYLNEVIEIGMLNKVDKVYVSLLGDLISNSLHKTIEVSNKENVIDQMKIAIELITSFIYELCKNFNNVYMTSVSGNHSRLQAKDLSQHSERLDAFIAWDVCKSLKYVENFHSLDECSIDDGIALIDINNKWYAMVHGDFDYSSIKGYASLSNMLGMMPDYIITGHKHYCKYDESIKFIQSGSLAGSGDDYTIEKRLNGEPSQMVIVCRGDNISLNPITLK